MEKSNSIILVMSQNLSESGGRRLMDLSVTRAASSEEKPVCGCRSKWVDQQFIMKSIRKWDWKNIFCFCSLCFLGEEAKTIDERCLIWVFELVDRKEDDWPSLMERNFIKKLLLFTDSFTSLWIRKGC